MSGKFYVLGPVKYLTEDSTALKRYLRKAVAQGEIPNPVALLLDWSESALGLGFNQRDGVNDGDFKVTRSTRGGSAYWKDRDRGLSANIFQKSNDIRDLNTMYDFLCRLSIDAVGQIANPNSLQLHSRYMLFPKPEGYRGCFDGFDISYDGTTFGTIATSRTTFGENGNRTSCVTGHMCLRTRDPEHKKMLKSMSGYDSQQDLEAAKQFVTSLDSAGIRTSPQDLGKLIKENLQEPEELEPEWLRVEPNGHKEPNGGKFSFGLCGLERGDVHGVRKEPFKVARH